MTGGNDIVARFSLPTVDRALAALHRDEVLPHLLRDLSIDDVPSRVHSTASVQLSPPSLGCECPRVGAAASGGPDGRDGITSGGGAGEVLEPSGVGVRFEVRACTTPVPTTTPLPLDLHGEVCVEFHIERLSLDDNAELVTIDPICAHFTPAPESGLSDEMTVRVRAVVSRWLLATERARSLVVPLVLGLTSGEEMRIRDWWFSVDPGPETAAPPRSLTLALQIDRADAARPASVTRDLLGDKQAAFAVAGDLIERWIGELLPRPGDRLGTSSIRITASSATLRDGGFRIQVRGEHRQSILLWEVRFPFTVTQEVRVAVVAGRIRVTPDGEPRLDAGFPTPVIRPMVMPTIRAARDEALAWAEAFFADQLSEHGAVGGVLERMLDPSGRRTGGPASLRFSPSSIDITEEDGVLVRGSVDFGPDRPVQLRFSHRALLRVAELNALESWIPGGSIDLFRWRVGHGPLTSVQDDPHHFRRFLGRRSSLVEPSIDPLDLPPGVAAELRPSGGREPRAPAPHELDPRLSAVLEGNARLDLVDTVGERDGVTDVCLEVLGWSPGLNGERLPRSGTSCGMLVPALPRITLPDVDLPHLLGVRTTSSGAAWAHIAPWGLAGRPWAFSNADGNNVVLSFPRGDGSTTMLDELAERAVSAGVPLTVLRISPPGSGGGDARAGPGLRGSIRPDTAPPSVTRLWATDDRGAWRSAFQAGDGTMVLVDARGAVRARSESGDGIEEIAAALTQGGATAGDGWALLQAGVRPGDRAPAAVLPHGDRVVPLHRFRGRDLVLCFWRPGLDPSIEQVRRLGHRAKSTGGAVVFAVADRPGGEAPAAKPDTVAGVTVVDDGSGRLGDRFGIWCWPTTIHIDATGVVTDVRLGLSTAQREAHQHSRRSV